MPPDPPEEALKVVEHVVGAVQVESGITHGRSVARCSRITLEEGAVVQENLHDRQWLRMPDMPEVEVHRVQSVKAPTGVAGPELPAAAPAVAGAQLQLTAVRVRRRSLA